MKNRLPALLAVVLTLVLAGLTSACSNKTAAQLRAEHLAEAGAEVVVAIAWPTRSAKGTLIDGAQMALEEVNRGSTLLGGKKLRLVIKDDESSLTKGRLAAQEIANDPEVCAVLGHLNTYVAYPASQIYERAGIVMMTPGASGQKVTDGENKLVFRSLPGNRDQGRQIGEYASRQGYKSVAIYYIKNDYGIDLANYFEQRAHELGIQVVDRRSYDKNGDNHAAIFADWASFNKFDAIFLAGSLPEGAQIIGDIRNAGITVPIFAGVGLDSVELLKLGGRQLEKTVVFTLFNPNSADPLTRNFNQRYTKRFGRPPDSHAAQGYDGVNLLVHAMNAAHSREPAKIAAALRATRGWHGVTGEHSFNEKGDLVAKRLVRSTVLNAQFVFDE
ncbi:ABC transporter substrate-binding protein [Massilia sp. TSP1-1-2]|uniref:ABC transporter substrate-binding protein n=1 Tax=Massilia sp. TSP1-1-2 TaxID=2804649 RepID=UPI003CEAE8FF